MLTDNTPDAVPDAAAHAAGRWAPVAQAAASLGVHPRTVERRVAAGTLPHRRDERGRVLVLIEHEVAEEPQDLTAGRQGLQVVEAGDRSGTILATLADRSLAAGRVEVAEARRSARWGWSVAGSTAVVASVLVGVVMVRATGLVGEVAAARAEAAGAAALAATLASTLDREVARSDRLAAGLDQALRHGSGTAAGTARHAVEDAAVVAVDAGQVPDTMPDWWPRFRLGLDRR